MASYLSFMTAERVTPEALPHYLLDGTLSLRGRGGPAGPPLRSGRARESSRPSRRLPLVAKAAGDVDRARPALTEGEIRGILQILNEAGLAVSHPGRRGSEITPRGLVYLKWASNRVNLLTHIAY